MLLSVTESAKAVGCARSTLYDKIKSGELSRAVGGKIDVAELVRIFGQLKSDNSDNGVREVLPDTAMLEFMREQVTLAQTTTEQIRADLVDAQSRLDEHRANASLLENKSAEWQRALLERQNEIDEARREAGELAERLRKADARAKALQARGFIDRLLNRQPSLI